MLTAVLPSRLAWRVRLSWWTASTRNDSQRSVRKGNVYNNIIYNQVGASKKTEFKITCCDIVCRGEFLRTCLCLPVEEVVRRWRRVAWPATRAHDVSLFPETRPVTTELIKRKEWLMFTTSKSRTPPKDHESVCSTQTQVSFLLNRISVSRRSADQSRADCKGCFDYV